MDGDIIIADTAEDETAGKCVEIGNLTDSVVVSGLHTMAQRPKFEFGKRYLGVYMNSVSYHKQLLPLMQGIKVISISKTAIASTIIVYPQKIEEQNKIGAIFKIISNLLTLYQRKIGLLQQLKKAMLQRLFPDTDTYPKLRFGGFSGPWEQRKLRDVIDSEIKGKAKATMLGDKSVYLETGYLNGGIKQRVNSPTNVDEDDVLILWDGSKAGKLYHGFSGALGSTLKAFKPKFSGMFLYQYMSKDQDKIYQQYRTPNIPHVVKNFTDKYLVNLPNLQEQKQIGIFFNQLDTLITLQQRNLDNMHKLKKFMLQNLFI